MIMFANNCTKNNVSSNNIPLKKPNGRLKQKYFQFLLLGDQGVGKSTFARKSGFTTSQAFYQYNSHLTGFEFNIACCEPTPTGVPMMSVYSHHLFVFVDCTRANALKNVNNYITTFFTHQRVSARQLTQKTHSKTCVCGCQSHVVTLICSKMDLKSQFKTSIAVVQQFAAKNNYDIEYCAINMSAEKFSKIVTNTCDKRSDRALMLGFENNDPVVVPKTNISSIRKLRFLYVCIIAICLKTIHYFFVWNYSVFWCFPVFCILFYCIDKLKW